MVSNSTAEDKQRYLANTSKIRSTPRRREERIFDAPAAGTQRGNMRGILLFAYGDLVEATSARLLDDADVRLRSVGLELHAGSQVVEAFAP